MSVAGFAPSDASGIRINLGMAHTHTTIMLIPIHPMMNPTQQRQIINGRSSPM